jgi:hypothetical protein
MIFTPEQPVITGTGIEVSFGPKGAHPDWQFLCLSWPESWQ